MAGVLVIWREVLALLFDPLAALFFVFCYIIFSRVWPLASEATPGVIFMRVFIGHCFIINVYSFIENSQ